MDAGVYSHVEEQSSMTRRVSRAAEKKPSSYDGGGTFPRYLTSGVQFEEEMLESVEQR